MRGKQRYWQMKRKKHQLYDFWSCWIMWFRCNHVYLQIYHNLFQTAGPSMEEWNRTVNIQKRERERKDSSATAESSTGRSYLQWGNKKRISGKRISGGALLEGLSLAGNVKWGAPLLLRLSPLISLFTIIVKCSLKAKMSIFQDLHFHTWRDFSTPMLWERKLY